MSENVLVQKYPLIGLQVHFLFPLLGSGYPNWYVPNNVCFSLFSCFVLDAKFFLAGNEQEVKRGLSVLWTKAP